MQTPQQTINAIGNSILLGSGNYFSYDNPEDSQITLEDVAYALGFECRFQGQCYSKKLKKRLFYSVAQHCVLMSAQVDADHALEALLHETGEAPCGDMNAPLKGMNPTYKAIEKRCGAAISTKLGLKSSDPAYIKDADLRMFATERRDLMNWQGEAWAFEDRLIPHAFEIIPWTPEQSAIAFIERFKELTTLDFKSHILPDLPGYQEALTSA